jgi:hypothetical protein
MKSNKRFVISVLTTALFVCCPSVSAQAVGEILGTVTDPTGAVIPKATVTATRTATGISQSTVTAAGGTYAIPNLVVGTYTVSVTAAGFKSETAAGVTLDVSQQRQVDFTLAVAGVTSTVSVTTAAPLVNTTNGTLGGLVSEEQVQTLPLNGRSIANLVMLQPGLAQDTGGMGWLAPMWIGNGNRGETAIATLDGADAADHEMGNIQFWNFNLDAIAEFKVLQNNYSAEYGSGGGTITEIVSKSGTNAFHGSAFEFLRNSAFDARNFFGTSVPPFQRNEFGATFGGPIVKNKTFFFGEYAGFRQRLGEPTVIPVPTADERQGLVTVGSYQYQVPMNSVAQQILGKYPEPNQPGGLFGANTLNFLFKQPTNDDQFSVRLDQYFSAKDNLFVRASYINNSALEQDPVAAIENPSFSPKLFNNPRNYSIGETHIFSPTLLNSFTFTLNRQIQGDLPPSSALTQTTFSDGSLANWGPDTFVASYLQTHFKPEDKLTWTRGRHTLSMGVSYSRNQNNNYGGGGLGPNGAYTFTPGTPLPATIASTNGGPPLMAGTGSPNALISMMEGDAFTYGRGVSAPGYGPPGGGLVPWGMRGWSLATWIQDDFRVTSKLTFNLGLRYEYNSVPYEVGNRLGEIAEHGNLRGRFVLNPSPVFEPDYPNFGPRLGIAYRVTHKTVLRGGFAIFSNMIPMVYSDQTASSFPLESLSYLSSPTYSLTPLPVSLPVLVSLSGQLMPPNGNTKLIPPNTPVNLAPTAAAIGVLGAWYPSDRLRNGYTINENLTVEQELPANVVLQLSYVGNNGVHLYNEGFPNAYTGAEAQYAPYSQITPGLGELAIIYNGAYSSYHALQVQARKISSQHGIQFQANYTWAKDMTDADAVWSAPGASGGITPNNPQCLKCEYGPASYSVNQRFVANFEYNLPVGSGIFSALPRRLTQGWRILGIFSAQTGFPFTVVGPYGTLQYGFDSLDGVTARPFFVQKATLNTGGAPQFFSNAVIADNGMNGQFFAVPTTTSPTIGTVQTVPGNLGRNTFTGPSWSNVDFSIIKETHLTELTTLQFRAEFFNLLNQATFATPVSTLSNPAFGFSTATATPERQIQFGLRFIF